ncbi:MAG: acylphosphatase [Leptolyngbya sp. SIO1E4]|nr:acylphosphatase [Leptolyngbya sp. SIO1E4]
MERIRIIVRGLVQGVGYRYNTLAKASQLGLTGYVKNLPDGTVEIVAEGPSPSLNQLLDWARQGPPAAEVQQVDVTYDTANGEFGNFSIER